MVKTRQVTYSVLNHLIDYVQNLEKVGILEEKEMIHLHEAVQVIFPRHSVSVSSYIYLNKSPQLM